MTIQDSEVMVAWWPILPDGELRDRCSRKACSQPADPGGYGSSFESSAPHAKPEVPTSPSETLAPGLSFRLALRKFSAVPILRRHLLRQAAMLIVVLPPVGGRGHLSMTTAMKCDGVFARLLRAAGRFT